MKMVFRWYGLGDSIPLTYIRQIPGMTGVVTAVYDIPVGEVWQTERILALRDACRAAGLEMEVIESVPVHEDIKLGRPSRDRYIENYAATIENLGRAGVRCICYNFMPVFDWLRTNLHTPLADGSNALSYCHEELMGLDPHCLHLPGWDESYTQSQLDTLLGAYAGMSHGELFDNLVYFLRGIMPACDRAGVNMAIHPDDPAFLLGRDLLAACVLDQGIEDIEVYLPSGEIWYKDDRCYTGGQAVALHIPATGTVPYFVRGGCVFPLDIGTTGFQKPSRVQFTVYPIADGTFQSRYFDDDGHTYAYRDGHCVDAVFTVACAADTVTVQVENRGDTPFAPNIRLTPADHRQLIIK